MRADLLLADAVSLLLLYAVALLGLRVLPRRDADDLLEGLRDFARLDVHWDADNRSVLDAARGFDDHMASVSDRKLPRVKIVNLPGSSKPHTDYVHRFFIADQHRGLGSIVGGIARGLCCCCSGFRTRGGIACGGFRTRGGIAYGSFRTRGGIACGGFRNLGADCGCLRYFGADCGFFLVDGYLRFSVFRSFFLVDGYRDFGAVRNLFLVDHRLCFRSFFLVNSHRNLCII